MAEDVPNHQRKPERPHEPPPCLRVADVAQHFQVSTGTVHRWLKDGVLRHFRTADNTIRIRRADFEAFEAEHLVPIGGACPRGGDASALVAMRAENERLRRRVQELEALLGNIHRMTGQVAQASSDRAASWDRAIAAAAAEAQLPPRERAEKKALEEEERRRRFEERRAKTIEKRQRATGKHRPE